MEKGNKIYIFKFFYAIIMFLGILTLPFLILTFQNDYEVAVEEYNDAVKFALSEDFVVTKAEKDKIISLLDAVDNARVQKHFNIFNSFMIILIFLSLLNYFFILVGIRYKVIDPTANMLLNRRLLIIVSIVEILYFVGLLVFASSEYIGINFWTLFFVNIIIVIFVVVLSLQVQYLLKPKTTESH